MKSKAGGLIIPRKGFKCRNDSKWVETLEKLNLGDTFDVPMKNRESIYRAASRLGYKISGRQLGRKDFLTIYFEGKK